MKSLTLTTGRSRVYILSSIAIITLSLFMTILTIATITTNNEFDNPALAQSQAGNSTATTSTSSGNNNNNTNNKTAAGGGESGNITNIDSFRTRGQISSLASDIMAGRPSASSSQMWVLGGNWEFGVQKGNLTNLAIDITMSQIDGKGAHRHTIESLKNATGEVIPGRSKLIELTNGNYTDFKGIANITTNGKVKWQDVPVIIHLVNGNIVNFNVDASKTEDHFKGLPVFGTVQSIIDQNGRELLKR